MNRRSLGRAIPRHGGFSLIEALIALLVVAVGALAIARFSGMLSRQAESARHRTEAVLLAQAKLDELRSQLQLEAAGTSPSVPASGTDEPVVASNTAFTRRWEVAGAPTDPQRRIGVQIEWADRDGQADATGVRLEALVARADPAGTARLALPTGETTATRQPFGRSIAIPWEAVRLGGANRGRSVLRGAATGSTHLVFDDASGQVVAECGAMPDDRTDIAAACAPIDALLLSGFLSGPGAAGVTDVAFDPLQHAVAVPVCRIEAALSPEGRPLSDWRAYRCLVRPGDHDGNAGTARVWSGRAILLPRPTPPHAVCRYTTDAAPDGGPPRNEDHPASYTLVSRSLSHQNFAVTTGGPCPDGSVIHQPE